MILDTSALVAIFLREGEQERLLRAIDEAATVAVSASTLLETAIVLSARLGTDALPALELFLHRFDIVVVPFDRDHLRLAVEGWSRFGKGRHPAGLNLGDCASYATARLASDTLLFKGEDFARRDVRVAPF